MKYNKFDRFLDVTFFILYQGSLYFEHKIKKFQKKKENFFNQIKDRKELQKITFLIVKIERNINFH